MENNIYISPKETRKENERLPIYTRAENAPSIWLTERDRAILEAIHAFDGMLADYQIQRLFFSGRRQMQHRMSLLFHHGYVDRPDRKKRAAISTMVYWLGKKGAGQVAGLSGQNLSHFKYRKEPKWLTLEHDLAINDFRLAVTKACEIDLGLTLRQWIPDGEFWANPDRVEFKLPGGKRKTTLMKPDGFFSIVAGGYRNNFLLEMDMATEDNPRFVRQKVLPGVAYLKSKAYRDRFGENMGQWLVVTTGERRMENLLNQTRNALGTQASLFYFSTIDQIRPDIVLSKPIWKRADSGTDQPLLASQL